MKISIIIFNKDEWMTTDQVKGEYSSKELYDEIRRNCSEKMSQLQQVTKKKGAPRIS